MMLGWPGTGMKPGCREAADGTAGTLPELVDKLALASVQEGEEFAAVEEEIADQFVPGVAIHLLGDDAEIEADVDEDGADRAVTDLVGDFLGRGQAGEIAGRRRGLAGLVARGLR
jgi:hypothetical protein